MIKRTVFIGGVVLILGLLMFGHDALSYVRTSAGCLKDAVHNSVPVEFQIERARRMIKDLAPEVRKNMHLIAKEEVEVERLHKRIDATETRSSKEKDQLLRLKGDLGRGGSVFMYAGREYTPEQVRTDLANRFERYKTNEATLASLRKIHHARQKSLDAARAKLEGMLAARRQLQVEVENLEAQRQMIAAAATTSEYNFDDSRLGRVKELINDLQVRLDTQKKLVDAEDYFHDEIPLEEAAPENIVERITEYFGPDDPATGSVATQ